MNKFKLVLKEPLRIFYFIQGHILWFIHKHAILKFLERSVECNKCYRSGFCVHCGCEIGPMFMSSIKCKKDVVEQDS
jgi:hypothetical protein